MERCPSGWCGRKYFAHIDGLLCFAKNGKDFLNLLSLIVVVVYDVDALVLEM